MQPEFRDVLEPSFNVIWMSKRSLRLLNKSPKTEGQAGVGGNPKSAPKWEFSRLGGATPLRLNIWLVGSKSCSFPLTV